MHGSVANFVVRRDLTLSKLVLDRATPSATPMSKDDTAPTKENERESDSVSCGILSRLKIVRLVLEVITLVARLLSML